MKSGTLIIGGSVAGLQAAMDLADAGIPVHLVESTPFLGNTGRDSIPEHILNTRLLEVIRHPNIRVWTRTEISQVEVGDAQYLVRLHQHPRYVDASRCTACGACLEVCPVTLADGRKAISLDGQPACMAIEKAGRSPCASSCPAGIHVQGYVALIAQGRFREAIDLIRQVMPFPSVCGRVCNHQCEANCTRGQVDQPVNIMALKRFVADWEYAHREEAPGRTDTPIPGANGSRVAIIGAGPAGLTAARDLRRLGYAVTVFEALPIAGGMMRAGIPPHRLPSEYLDWEIQQVINEGVALKLNTRVDDIPGLLRDGYQAVLIATGAHVARKLSIRNCNHPDNWLSLDVLRRTCLGEKIDLSGKRIVVLGGGNVSLDTARTVLRLGASEVRMACLEPRGEMPGFAWEIGVAEEEGIEICPGRTFHEIVVRRNKITGVRCSQVDFRGFKGGRPDMDVIPDTEHILSADIVIWAIGQGPDFSFLPQDGSINTRYPIGIQSDENMMTTLPGVFVAGDVHRGVTFFVVDAIGEGHRAARKIDRYLRGEAGVQEPLPQPKVTYDVQEAKAKLKQSKFARQKRVQIASIPLEERIHNFREVDLTISEAQALAEARRCLTCGPCSECLACEQVCQPGAICHDQQGSLAEVEVGAILVADELPGSFRGSLPSGPEVHSLPVDDVLAASAASARVLASQAGQCRPIPVAPAPALAQGAGRIGVFICQCGDRIANVVDTGALCDQVTGLPNVVHAQVISFSCSPQAAETIDQAIQTNQLDRVVLAACSCCSVNQVCFSCTYQRVRCKQNLGLFTYEADPFERVHPAQSARFEFVNIREQCAWVHADDPQAATHKAMDLIAATVARVGVAPILLAGVRKVEHSVLVLGKGPAGPLCREMLRRQGITAQSLADLPDQIWRSGGQYQLSKGDQTWQVSVLVLAPRNKREHDQLLARFGRERRRPEANPLWGGVETRRPGVFYCEPAQDSERVSAAAAARVAAWLGRAESRPPIAAVVDPERCRACKTCIETCEYSAPELVEINGRRSAWIDPAMCRGCGTCAVHCPSGAITAGCSTDAQVQAMLNSILAGGASLK